MLHGRDAERARLAAGLDAARAGRADLLLIHGEAGAGKSALLEDTAARAGDFRVLRTVGLQSESPLAFAALHRLLRPVLDLASRLPAPQARALRVAFGEEEGAHVDPFLIALATLSMLTEAAATGPVLCLVDDAQWLDVASTDALLFAARRLQADPVSVVLAARDEDEAGFRPDGIPTLPLGGLAEPAVRALVEERAGGPVAGHVVEQLTAQTGGNPLAVVELPGQLSESQLDGSAQLPTDLHLTAAVERVFLDRCRRLSREGQTLMLVAAADDSADLATVLSAGSTLGAPAGALHEVERAGLLVTTGDHVSVRHPLVRSAVYQAATGLERRNVHAALALALGRAGDPERQVWHRAAAAGGPDEVVALALAEAGARAENRGGYEAAAAAHERSAQLTPEGGGRARGLFAAARNAYAAGQTARAQALLALARAQAHDLLLRADIDRLRGRLEVIVGSAPDAHRIFVQAAGAVAREDPARALEMAAAAGVLLSHGADSGARLDAETVPVTVAPEDTVRTRCLKHLLVCTTRDAAGDWAGALAALRPALAIGLEAEDRDVWANLGNAALHVGDDASHRRYFTIMLSAAREDGAVMDVLYALHRLSFSQLAGGEWSAVRASANEALALARSMGQRSQTAAPLAWLTLLAALEGRPEYDALLADTRQVMDQAALGVLAEPVHDLVRWARGTRAGEEGETSEALHHLGRMRVPALTRLAALDRIGAARRAGQDEQARAWVDELGAFAGATALPWALAVTEHGRALLADAAEAPVHFERSLAHHDVAGRPYDHARTRLAYGELLRRSQRRVDARTHLRLALETFEDLRAEPLLARTARELRASGTTARKRDPSTVTQLTPTELQIAQLVSQGLSNKDVAAHCWISPRTVAFHLRNVFTKTGVASRGELAQLDLG